MDEATIGGITGLIGASIGILVGIMVPRWIGWKKLADRFPAEPLYAGVWQRWQSGKVGFCNMNWGLKIGVTTEALHIAVEKQLIWDIFGLWPELQIPWTSISKVSDKNKQLMLYVDGVQIILPKQVIPGSAIARISN